MERTGNMQQRLGGFKSQVRKLMAVCIGGILLLSSGQGLADSLHEGLQSLSLKSQVGVSSKVDVTGTHAKCEFSTAGAGSSTAVSKQSLTLSKGSLTATLECTAKDGGTISSIPNPLAGNVCVTKQKQSETPCNFGENGGAAASVQVPLKDVLGTTSAVQWMNTTAEQKAIQSQKWTLKLNEEDLPISDKTFDVGCTYTTTGKAAANPAVCQLTVNVKARASSVADENVVTCSYGAESNSEALKVDMTTTRNTVTIDCGSEGTLNPAADSAQYCNPQNKDLDDCKKKFVDILPNFVISWWKTPTPGNASILTIPAADFPESEQQFRLGCVPNKAPQSDSQDTRVDNQSQVQSRTSAPTTCSVLVTVKAASSASYASPSLQTLIAVSGAAVVSGFVVASL
ncbi:SAG-related sequence SRS16B [Toxoplasma gondii TgCatPRC2]|uniref:SAG-related sequence SRS16B n=4 Tax=Toxoplasma gondii TaxID=5811 RepID=A0A125YJX4_TOXGG|nr:SAG-related sequence SRS16B [Toxoplasma gondii ME49]AAM27530.1 putative bradyzoite-specific surface protein [Toxoplasma gondii]EPR58094.1 SAG-related sequence SRS16B [Toxoplasma gondii GT1]KYK66788.1 SAG-related sequence SRS16B [Toxoplasma gondii TgCatPRC2]EPT31567.1 SAG-related sequence SRS16B [Toxoplasma gondii ME49]KAF4644878.1 SAG-related sequence SRS16B [Toxoplasma gondii]|eukprot:XP_002369886.1 SAG-related sequence SRS16B [Toxoplasma gondii ME49]